MMYVGEDVGHSGHGHRGGCTSPAWAVGVQQGTRSGRKDGRGGLHKVATGALLNLSLCLFTLCLATTSASTTTSAATVCSSAFCLTLATSTAASTPATLAQTPTPR